jgi:hypothetical protein
VEGKVVYSDEDLDIVLVKVPGENFPYLARAIPLPEGRHEILTRDGKSADRGISNRTIKHWRLSRSPGRQHHSNALAPATSRIRRASARLIQQCLTRTDELLRLLLVDRQPAELRSLQHRLDLRSQGITLRGP